MALALTYPFFLYRLFVVVFIVNKKQTDSLLKITETMKDILGAVNLKDSGQIVSLFNDESTRKNFISNGRNFSSNEEWENNCLNLFK